MEISQTEDLHLLLNKTMHTALPPKVSIVPTVDEIKLFLIIFIWKCQQMHKQFWKNNNHEGEYCSYSILSSLSYKCPQTVICNKV